MTETDGQAIYFFIKEANGISQKEVPREIRQVSFAVKKIALKT